MSRAAARVAIEGRIEAARPRSVLLAMWAFGTAMTACLAFWFYRIILILLELIRVLSISPAFAWCGLVAVFVLLGAAVLWLQYGLWRGRLWALGLVLALLALMLALPGGLWYYTIPIGQFGRDAWWLWLPLVPILATFLMLAWPTSLYWLFIAARLRGMPPDRKEQYVRSLLTKPLALLAIAAAAAAPGGSPARGDEDPGAPQITPIFSPENKHNHASCVVELPGGDLFTVWYRGSGERRSDDVEIWAARLQKGETAWNPRFLLADTPGYPDCNPAAFAAPDGALWIFWPTILDHRWEGALLKFAVAAEAPDHDKPVRWAREGVLHITPEGFDRAMADAIAGLPATVRPLVERWLGTAETRSKDLLYQRLGWMPRVHVTVLPNGRWVLPLYTDTFSCSIMALSDDQGKTWKTGAPMIGWGNIQPSIVRRNDGTLVAFMRDNGPFRKIRTSTSTDEGQTWGPVTSTELPNPGAGVEAIRLASGRWAIVYNDTTAGRHSLALSLSDDEGRTWKWTRHVARDPAGKESFHYPSLLQTSDGTIHVTYTHGNQPAGSSIDHARLTEEWLMKAQP